jgi:polyphosphate glucokinase
MSEALGVDIGGSAIKTAIVDTSGGILLSPCETIPVTRGATPQIIADELTAQIKRLSWRAAVGVGYPGVVKQGCTLTAAHLSDEWLGFDFLALLGSLTTSPVALLNDADAAGLAEMHFGAGTEMNGPGDGTVLMLTFGTGIGSALFRAGQLFPNTEFGHIELDGAEAENTAAASVKTKLDLDWPAWGKRVNRYLEEMEKLLSPDMVIVGGGISESFGRFKGYLTPKARIVPARFGNSAGLIGAALAVTKAQSEET